MTAYKFFVPGGARPKGSNHVASIVRKSGRPFVRDATKGLKQWQKTITQHALHQCPEPSTPWFEDKHPVQVQLMFMLARPRTNKTEVPVYKPDLDKLIRAVLDALSGTAYKDDCQVNVIAATKGWAPSQAEAGVYVTVIG